ncbi:hypothetical protein [Nocardioides sp. cx-173]|uniref:hypothetical protein n=1 Tax=Nocardioides sp. cx-173 TaxID=2898796 RepID=UPI001E424CBA|nr:hypothetical protein [Nocardioides sp. cx-173]MCD4527436.1 hypothetical protein [Nocardioides sp. cx-173]UGB41001.1 hypothetical protein LQ940_16700 [Nocardioides sp. cx-173]
MTARASGFLGRAEANPVFAALSVLLLVGAALLLLAAAESGWWLVWWLAAVAGAAGFLFLALSGAGRNARRRIACHGGVVTVRMRRAFPLAAAGFTLVMAALFAVSAAREEEALVRVVAVGCGLLFAAAIPDLVRAAATGGQLTFDAHRIRVRSWGSESAVDWADVEDVDVDVTLPSRPAVRILTRSPAPSLSVRRRRLLLPLEPRFPEGQIIVPALALDEPWLLAGRLATLVGLSPEHREHHLTSHTVTLLTGSA